MTKRATKNPSKVFANVLKQAEQKLLLEAGAAENFDHRGLKGGERTAALAEFLGKHLPAVFGVGGGEAIDFRDNRTGELDLFIYDKSTAAPIQSSTDSSLVPAEALYAVIEVKSVLSQDEMNKCMLAGKRVRELRPFKGHFIASPVDGKRHEEHYRCPYFVFAYTSNLSRDDWAQKEFDRTKLAANSAECSLDIVDRVFVLDRGILRPQIGAASVWENSSGIFLDFYIHLINFLTRERARRPTIDWTAYTARGRWVKLR
ncbi:hypothetical protein GCM10011611_14890 [Aliidongia dinghuensis]|uniref:DUF6602 domain-containing protein n=1 Tax=Aliidongia dinghuensis TaxID=1867774 RepID=A0A8J2YS48_9PROT|nr:DUF6602 domain-containing protein [Aliidongia dinghuensis]GGF10335.1 hypothetical protein GCM10011611_14890 [Aliidongia dinghuensis]